MRILVREDFEPLVNQIFRLDWEVGQRLELRLVSVTPRSTGGRSAGREPFSLIFHGPLEPLLPQRTYALENVSLGVEKVFLVPLGPKGGFIRWVHQI